MTTGIILSTNLFQTQVKMSMQAKPRVLAIVSPEYAGEDYIAAFKAEFDLEVRMALVLVSGQ